MNWHYELQALLQSAAESTRLNAIVSTFSSAAGLLTLGQFLTGIAAGAAVFAGLGCSLVLIRLNMIKIKNEHLKNAMLRARAEENGIELREDD